MRLHARRSSLRKIETSSDFVDKGHEPPSLASDLLFLLVFALQYRLKVLFRLAFSIRP